MGPKLLCLLPALLLTACMVSKKGSGRTDTHVDVTEEDTHSEATDPDFTDPEPEPTDITETHDPVIDEPDVEDPVTEDAAPEEPECTTDPDCDDGDPCTLDACESGTCTHGPLDRDLDGHVAERCGGDDCDDSRSDVYDGAPEVCLDGVDQDCDTIIDGMMIMGADLRVTDTTAGLFSFTSSIVWTGSEFGVAFQDNRSGSYSYYLTRVSDTSTKIGSDNAIAPSSGDPFLAWSGSEFGASWVAYATSSLEIHFARVSPTGSLVGSPLQVTDTTELSTGPSLAWTGSEYGLSWYDERDGNREIYFARISPTATKIGSDVRVTDDAASSDNIGSRSLAWTGSEFGLSWCDDRDGAKEVYFARLSSSGSKIGSDTRITTVASFAMSSALTWSGSEFGLTWTCDRSGNREVYFARLSSSGSKIGSDIRITTAANDGEFPDIAWTGSEYGLTWSDERLVVDQGNVYFVRLTPTGTIKPPELRVSTNHSIMPSLAWTGSQYSISWEDNRLGSWEIFFHRIGFCE